MATKPTKRDAPRHVKGQEAREREAEAVLNALGVGFLETVYENALAHELRKIGLAVAQQRGVTVVYDGTVVGEYFVDLLVEQALLVELKAVKALDEGASPRITARARSVRNFVRMEVGFHGGLGLGIHVVVSGKLDLTRASQPPRCGMRAT